MSMRPEDRNRRSFIYPRLIEASAEFGEIEDSVVALGFPGEEPPPLGLTDLSPLPRTGLRGRGALTWLSEQGWSVPANNNTALQTGAGGTLLRLRDYEALVLCGPRDEAPGHEIFDLERHIPGGNVWHAPRRDSHCWFQLRGAAAVDCMAKLCAVDLRPHVFPAGSVAQTSVARLNTIVYAGFEPDITTFGLLADSASAIWFWDTLLDAMGEYGGRPVGLHEGLA